MNRYKRIVGHWFPMSPDEVAGGAAPPAAAVVAPTAPAAPEAAQPSKQEWVDVHKTLRELATGLKAVTEAVKPKEQAKADSKPDTSADLAATNAKIDAMVFENNLIRAMAKAKIADDHPAYELIEKVAKAEKPTDLAAFIARYASLAQPVPVVPAAAPVVPPIAKSDTGAARATTTDAGTPDGHPFKWPPEVIAKMSPEELRKAARDYENKNSGSANVLEVFEARRNRAKAAEASAKK